MRRAPRGRPDIGDNGCVRGKRWDIITLGPARRRRRMARQLRDLDRWYAGQRTRHAAPGARAEALRGSLVGILTTVAVLAATWVVLHEQGYSVGSDGVTRRMGAGPLAGVRDAGAYAFVAHQAGDPGSPVAYDPCRPIHVVVNDELAPPGADEILHSALTEASRATGLRFVRDGRTDELPASDRPLRDPARYGGGWSPVLVAWTTAAQDPRLAGDVAGLGGSAAVAERLTGRRRYVTGTVSLDSPALSGLLRRGPDGSRRARAVVLHELGHVLGLGHVADRGELMHAESLTRTSFGPGDRAGLARLGRGRCTG